MAFGVSHKCVAWMLEKESKFPFYSTVEVISSKKLNLSAVKREPPRKTIRMKTLKKHIQEKEPKKKKY